MTENERLKKVLQGEHPDRRPVICPGGMMSAATTTVLRKGQGDYHRDAVAMADIAMAIRTNTGFENLGVPFCMTVEAEVLGAGVNLGNPGVEPLVTDYVGEAISDLLDRSYPDVATAGRIPVITRAIEILEKTCPDTPVIGNLTGPISLITSLMEPMDFFRKLRRDRQFVRESLDYVTGFLIAYARQQIRAGADVIAIADPTATGEILGPQNFAQYATPYLTKLVQAVNAAGVPVILHICGDATTIIEEMRAIKPNALSFDAIVNMGRTKEVIPDIPLMGNLSTQLLHQGNPERITVAARVNQSFGVDIHAPACGISLATPGENLRSFTACVKDFQ